MDEATLTQTLAQKSWREYGHFCAPNSVTDHGVLVQGDHATVNNYHRDMEAEGRDKKYQLLLNSLAFERMGSRARNVGKPLPAT